MSWFKRLFQRSSITEPKAVVGFYKELDFFAAVEPSLVIQEYSECHGSPPDPANPWDDVFLLALSADGVWSEDPEADVCAENEVYSNVLSAWGNISGGVFAPAEIKEVWDTECGPIRLNFTLNGQMKSISPAYLDDWIDLDVLRQINAMIAPTGRQFAYAIDGNFALVVCLTSQQKKRMISERHFPFAW